MIDQGDFPKPPETKLTPEQTTKADLDLITLSTLSAFATANNSVMEIAGGYATEAWLGGNMTRPHGDMDTVLWLADPNNESLVQNEVEKLLRQEKTKWGDRINEKDREHFMELREDASVVPFGNRRRIELYTFPGPSKRPLVEKTLIDSHGNEHVVMVTTLEEIVADKVRIYNRTADEKVNKRATNQTDVDDFNRLIKHPEFSKEKYLQTMAGYLVYKSSGTLIEEHTLSQAESMWHIALLAIPSSPETL